MKKPAAKKSAPAPAKAPRAKKPRPTETAESMAARQREISISEFFTKNRHLLGFDNPRKALLTAVKEAVDNALDACEDAGILPEVLIEIKELSASRYRLAVQDNGPGIVKRQIPNIFGKLLYGSKFHRLKMSRGQQGIGISAAGMYGMLTTGKPVVITSRTSKRHPAHHFELQIDTKKNKPEIIVDTEIEWEVHHGTRVEIELEGKHTRGRQSVDEYLRQTAITNPHISVEYRMPGDENISYERTVKELPPHTKEIKPHPQGVELGAMLGYLKESKAPSLSGFLQEEFSRVTSKVAAEICANAGLSPKAYAKRIGRGEVEKLMQGIKATKIMNPPTNCVAPIGEEQLVKGLASVVPADFYASTTRPPAVYRGNPFIIEAALAYGGEEQNGDSPARLLRFANRVPLLYQQGACCTHRCSVQVNWRNYSLQQPRGALPVGPLTIVVHMASVWVPFTSESKEAIAEYPEIEEQVIRALQECGRKLKIFLSRRRREADTERKQDYIKTYIPHIGIGLRALIGFSEREEQHVVKSLTGLLERARDK
ncbi:MAG: DNA topoisomerase VI subunit B [Planctomycetes bacterium]|nr:DNA topoisomerase VI subunit B [Planctomycetota bacterium]